MELVNIDNLKPGFIVASAVTNKGGAVLVPPGLNLTQSTIDRLKASGVESVIVEKRGVRGVTTDQRLNALTRRFEGVEDPILLQLKATMEQRLNLIKLESGA